MSTKVALLVIYNHRFDKNINRINNLYAGRFSHVYHVMPFYDGNQENVIPVYASSHNFQSYIAQAYQHLKKKNFTHYFVISDDMILNPRIDENQLWDITGIKQDECYISSLIILQNHTNPWYQIKRAIEYRLSHPGVEVHNILPSREKAKERFAQKGIPTGPLPYAVWRGVYPEKITSLQYWKARAWKYDIRQKAIELDYPMVGGYSDILLLPESGMQIFCTYCGAFAAGSLFVELAIPTALVLSYDKIKTDKDTLLKGQAMWSAEDFKLVEKYQHSLEALLKDFPASRLFLHPIKLSEWK